MSESQFFIDQEAITQLAEILKKTGLDEIEYQIEDRRVRLVRHQVQQAVTSYVTQTAAPAQGPAEPAAAPALSSAPDFLNHPGLMRSPMVGTAYMSPEPGAPAFVKVGDQVNAGQTLLIIEAMKVMNPLKAPKAGRILHVFSHDSMPVEYGEPLLVIE
jgi:acetyl-CoA carboxylase biotin carboxyl carrier protein